MPVLSNIDQVDLNIQLGSKHAKLWALAKAFGGGCTKHFGQGSDDERKGLGFWYHQKAGWHGVCKALSVYWIFFHALDQDFWGWLYSGKSKIDATKAAKIIDLHGSYKTRAKGLSKDGWTDGKLWGAKLIPRKEIVGGARLRLSAVADQAPLVAGLAMAEAVASQGYEGGSYKQLSFHSPKGGGHAVAAWVERDVAFFDPNYGEYWFETKEGFRQWFGQFWVETGYGAKYSSEYNYTSYARKIG